MDDMGITGDGPRSRRERKSGRSFHRRVWRLAIFTLITLVSTIVIIAGLWWITPKAPAPAEQAAQLDREWRDLHRSSRFDEARIKLVDYLEIIPGDWRARETLVDILWRQGKTAAAFAELTTAAAAAEPSAQRFLHLGLLALRVNDGTAAVEFLTDAVNEEQVFVTRAELAKALSDAGQYDRAILNWEEARRMLPEGAAQSAVIDREIGDILARQGDDTRIVGPDTVITGLPHMIGATGTVELEGIAVGGADIESIRVAIGGADGRYWDSVSTTWSTEPVLHRASILDRGPDDVFWVWSGTRPSSDGGRFFLTAAAVDTSGTFDPTPAGTVLIVDDQPPSVEGLELAQGQVSVARRSVAVRSRVGGAVGMRFSEDPVDLQNQPYRQLSTRTKVRLSDGAGDKVVYGQWRDAAGNETRPGVRGSTATVILDTDPPEIVSTFPRPGAVDVNIDVLVTANFEELSFDAQSISQKTFSLRDRQGKEVPVDVRYDQVSGTAIMAPAQSLEYGHKYQAVLAAAVRDNLGNTLSRDWPWSFTTIGASTHPPGRPGDLQVVSDEEGNRLSWNSPRTADHGGDFDPPTQGGYYIYRGSTPAESFQLVNRVPLTKTSYLDAEYGRPGIYYYAVRAVDAGGSEGPATKIRSNETINAFYRFRPKGRKIVVSSNGVVGLELGEIEEAVTVSIKSRDFPDAPPSPIGAVELESSRPVRLKYIALIVPGDPFGALIARSRGDGWQPLALSRHSYDAEQHVVSYRSVAAKWAYTVVNPTDKTPPSSVGPVEVSYADGRPVLAWNPSLDADSGISGYRLTVGQMLTTQSSTSETVEDSATVTQIDLPPGTTAFTDYGTRNGLRYYGVAAINGADVVGPIETLAVTVAPELNSRHKPTLIDAGSCRSCHLSEPELVARTARCGLCHDGTGSKINLATEERGRRACRACHNLRAAQLARADASDTVTCGGCHEDAQANKSASVSSHETTSSLTAAGCGSCHGLHQPDGGNSDYLVDPYNTRHTWRGSASEFCLTCHSGASLPSATDTAATFVPRSLVFPVGTDPLFSSGLIKRDWSRSTHSRVSDCATCHDPHESSNSDLIVFKGEGGAKKYFSPATAPDSLCFQCHGARNSAGAPDVQSHTLLASGHSVRDAGRRGEGGGAGRGPRCVDCHDVHTSDGSSGRAGSNRVSGPLKGSGGVAPVNGGPGSIPEWVEVSRAAYEYQICLKCHSSYAGVPVSGSGDMGILFNPANPSYHPVEARVRERGTDPATFANGWKPDSTMYCSDCHGGRSGSESGSGPHGSNYRPLLAAAFGADAKQGDRNNLCFQCHNREVYEGSKSGSRFSGRSGHRGHAQRRGMSCGSCHEVHGSAFNAHLIKITRPLETSGTTVFRHDRTGGSCVASCHKRPKEEKTYRHAY